MKRRTLIAIFISLAIHGVVLFAFIPRQFVEATSAAGVPPRTLSVRITGLPSKQLLPAVLPAPIKPHMPDVEVLPIASEKTIEPNKPDVESQPIAPVTPVIAVEKSVIVAPAATTIKAPLAAENSAPPDFISYVNAKRKHAQDLEDSAAVENAAALANVRGPTADMVADANIKRNLRQQGASGIFQIRHKTSRTAQFSFKGWKNDYSSPRLEIIDVEADADGDIDLAIVKKMIEIIRREYSGDFSWESRRLGRVIVLSARMEDNTGLEEFLMREFF